MARWSGSRSRQRCAALEILGRWLRRCFSQADNDATSVDQIVQTAGVAKGTFYYYFHSKNDVLAALASRLVEPDRRAVTQVARDPRLPATIAETAEHHHRSAGRGGCGKGVVEDLHRAENRELHERSNVETVRTFGPILTEVIEQGRREGVFHLDDPLATIQFILAGSLFLFGYGVFDWTPEERSARQRHADSDRARARRRARFILRARRPMRTDFGLGRGKVFPAKAAGSLLNPLRRLIQSPSRMTARMAVQRTDKVLEIGPRPGYFQPRHRRRRAGRAIGALRSAGRDARSRSGTAARSAEHRIHPRRRWVDAFFPGCVIRCGAAGFGAGGGSGPGRLSRGGGARAAARRQCDVCRKVAEAAISFPSKRCARGRRRTGWSWRRRERGLGWEYTARFRRA